jgi:hypothetical protein
LLSMMWALDICFSANTLLPSVVVVGVCRTRVCLFGGGQWGAAGCWSCQEEA